MKGLENWFEIFRTGTHTDSKGRELTYTAADLDKMVEAYNAQEAHEAPFVIGHPTDNAPAYGWTKGLKRVGEILYAAGTQVVPEFADMIAKGLFKKRSISIYPDGTLRHIGFLGAMPPAIKGMADIQFSADEDCHEFTSDLAEDFKMTAIGRVMRRVREFLIDKFDIETADRLLPNYEIETVREPEPAPVSRFSETETVESETDEDDGMNPEALTAQVDTLEGELSEKEKQIADLEKRIAANQAAERKKAYADFCAKLQTEGKLLESQVPLAVGLMEVLSGSDSHEFGEAGSKTPVVVLQDMLSAMPVQLPQEELAPGPDTGDEDATATNLTTADFADDVGVDEARLKLRNEALALSKKEGISFTEAVKQIQRKE
jgi:hypothetical protein